MKKIFKKSNIFSFLLGALIFGSIGVVSAYSIFANQISYSPSDTTWKKSNGEDITNVKDAIDELYIKANNSIKSGEAFLITASKGIKVNHSYNGYTAYLTISDLDFTDIKEFTYNYSLTTSDTSYQTVKLSDSNTAYININKSVNNETVVINGKNNLSFSANVSFENTGIFTVTSYTKMDNTVVEF